MEMIDLTSGTGHERVLLCRDPEAGYRGVIAIHSTVAGLAAGGTRFWSYASEEEAVQDALRLSRGMTYKNIMAGLPLGGGKSVILRDPGRNGGPVDREKLFRAHGRFIESLGGRYVTGEDVGTSPADMAFIRQETRHVVGLVTAERSGDPSPWTARGVVRAIQAAAVHRWGSDDLSGRRIAIQGCGNVGSLLARELREAGAELVVADVDPEKVRKVVEATGARAVGPEEILEAEADLLAPCALGGILNAQTIGDLRVEVVAGAANNQLLEPEDGDLLRELGILYAPDYVANAGGVISGCRELLGWSDEEASGRVERIYDTTLAVLRRADQLRISPHLAADWMAKERLKALRTVPAPGRSS